MATPCNYLAFDLGASSGRAMLGAFDGTRLTLEQLTRFENGPVCVHGHLYWDAFRLFEHIKAGIGVCSQRGVKLDAIGIDTWGVDFGLLAKGGELLAMPRHYRDARHAGGLARACAQVPRAEIYERTGLQFLPFNSLYQLVAMASEPARVLDVADKLLFMPDLFTYWLTGAARTEASIASTSQMLNPRTGRWDLDLVGRLGLPVRILPSIEQTGSIAGPLREDVARDVGQDGTPVIYTAGHDTASAVAAVPVAAGLGVRPAGQTDAASPEPGPSPDPSSPRRVSDLGGRGIGAWAYISSGTWSLVGVELAEPRITPATLAADFTNELGVGGTTRFLRNVAGLWLVQECQRTWASAGQKYSWHDLAQMAEQSRPLAAFVDPDDRRFAEPCDMPTRIRQVCQETGQLVPDSAGAVVRCGLESLALKYRVVLDTLESLLLRTIDVIHIVGGGSQNALLNQFTADATGKPIVAGPVEATAAGNVLVQALAQQRLASVVELRQVVAASSELKQFEPRDVDAWHEAAERYKRLFRGR